MLRAYAVFHRLIVLRVHVSVLGCRRMLGQFAFVAICARRVLTSRLFLGQGLIPLR